MGSNCLQKLKMVSDKLKVENKTKSLEDIAANMHDMPVSSIKLFATSM
jgi:hypothetical protein